MQIEKYLPVGDLPKTPHGGEEVDVFGEFQGPGAVTPWDHEISYKFNKHGYRCDEFDDRKDINVLSIGCSVTFGVGLPAPRRFSRVFCDLLSEHTNRKVADWNMGWSGCSCNYVARIAALAIPVLKPSVLLINFPALPRREFFDAEGEEYKHLPAGHQQTPKAKSLYKSHMDLSSAYQDVTNFFMIYKLIENLTKVHEVEWVYSIVNRPDDLRKYESIKDHCQTGVFVESMEKVDVARDGSHPGVLSNKQHGKNCFYKYRNHYVEKSARQDKVLGLLL